MVYDGVWKISTYEMCKSIVLALIRNSYTGGETRSVSEGGCFATRSIYNHGELRIS
jgi:hypothetical protein